MAQREPFGRGLGNLTRPLFGGLAAICLGVMALLLPVGLPSVAWAQSSSSPASCQISTYSEQCHADMVAQRYANCAAAGGFINSAGTCQPRQAAPGGGYSPAPSTSSPYQRSLDISGAALGAAADYFAEKEAEEQAQQQADDQARQEQAQRDAFAAQQKAQADARAAAEDAARRGGMADNFGGVPSDQSDPFNPAGPAAGVAGNPGIGDNGQPDPFETAALNPPAQVGGAADNQAGPGGPAAAQDPPAEPTPPNRKLGDPKQAASLAPITLSACQSMARTDIIKLPEGRAYCVVEVDTPEPTNEWHYLVDDPQPADGKFQIKTPGTAVNGVRG